MEKFEKRKKFKAAASMHIYLDRIDDIPIDMKLPFKGTFISWYIFIFMGLTIHHGV